MAKYWKLRIELTKEQHDALKKTVRSGVGGAMEIRRANVLLLADESEERKRQKDVVIANMLGITPQAVHDIKQHFLDRKAGHKSQDYRISMQHATGRQRKMDTQTHIGTSRGIGGYPLHIAHAGGRVLKKPE